MQIPDGSQSNRTQKCQTRNQKMIPARGTQTLESKHCPQVPRARHLWTMRIEREAAGYPESKDCPQVLRARHLWTMRVFQQS